MKLYIATTIILLTLISCDREKEQSTPIPIDPITEQFEELGEIPANVRVIASFQSGIFFEDNIYVATSAGVWRFDLLKNEWFLVGLEDEEIESIFIHPTTKRLFVGTNSDYSATDETLYLSDDLGVNWFRAETSIYDHLVGKRYENYTCFAVRPGYPEHIYANLDGGTMIAVSTDGGMNWERMNYKDESYFGYTSNIAFLPNNADQLFQGAEAPLDDAWLGSYEIDLKDPVLLKDFSLIVSTGLWSNRRPNELQTYDFSPNTFYVGQEGALSKVEDGNSKFIFISDQIERNWPYTYVQGIWVNPADPQHILFGGYLNSDEQPMSLYETKNEGEEIVSIEEKFGLENPEVREIIQTDTFPVVILSDRKANRVKLLMYRFN